MSGSLTLKIVLICTLLKKSNKLLKCCFKYVAGHLALSCHGNVNLEPNITLFLALVDPKDIILNLYELFRCTFDESR